MVQSFDQESELIHSLSPALTTCIALQVERVCTSVPLSLGAIIIPTNRVLRINKL